ncbi:glycoside hydrolase [Neocallimastix lanati (nom. inval.)]|uniref:alpha-1,2-Mannosidase n=1 Tax=Neocallimastix californiae TaxID=1754190 RepID=A0A1Y1YSI8_9FUNG|nr:glycoside hydrolase [Neocallimastix sp. JGI-2020a]ORY00988.1 glycoside hydrolase [Neocallimastix californiae]|eukprot:ORY00988.1 glycoside hydrolase [Neocallimastix californiae]
MTIKRKNELKEKVEEMIFHAFNGYMNYAFPSDELHPLACDGKDRDFENENNYGVNDILGNYTLTLIDSLDTLAIIGDKKAFENAVNKVIHTVNFDIDSQVSTFESNIRILGGLLAGHLFAINDDYGVKLDNYNDELLNLAYDLGKRLLPAFYNSTSEIPLNKVNLKSGASVNTDTLYNCSAGAGTFILEFGTLSRLTGDTRFENFARKALFKIWNNRSSLDLLGDMIDSSTSNWSGEITSVGAGIDSIFEYMLKGYILFGDPDYLTMTQDGLYVKVNMRTGSHYAYSMDGLTAFFPGVQVLMGDIDSAIHLHQIFIELWRKYHAIPESYNFLMKSVSANSYFLRPPNINFIIKIITITTTIIIIKATKDPYYLEIGEMVLNDLERLCRTECGFAQLNPLTSYSKEDRMESFFISESLKYLYLLFDEDNIINTRYTNALFTTEGHFLILPKKVYHQKDYDNSSYFNATSYNNIKCPNVSYNIGNPLLPKKERINIFKLVNYIHETEINSLLEDVCLK